MTHNGHLGARLLRRQTARFCLRSPSLGEVRALDSWLRHSWQLVESSEANPPLKRLLLVDEKIIAACATARDETGKWLISAGTWIDARSFSRLEEEIHRQALRLIGPVHRALLAERDGLCGYRLTLPLINLSTWAPAVDAAAYVQQVEAGAIDGDTLLATYLRSGARLVEIDEQASTPRAVLQWRR